MVNSKRPSSPPRYRPVVPRQKPPQFMQPAEQQFQTAGEARLGANNGITRQMRHFPQSGQHQSAQALHASDAACMAHQSARPKSSVPLQSQQQSMFPGGYLPTRGARAPTPPLPYSYQSSSVPPPVVQHQLVSGPATLPSVNSAEPSSLDWREHTLVDGKKFYHNRKTRQSCWQKPIELMTPWEVAQVRSAESSSSNWQEDTFTAGIKYYYNKKTKQSSWEKPAELMTPLERAGASTEWIEFCASKGRKYYYNRVTKESRWTIPNELKGSCELAETASNQPPYRETETIAGAPFGPTSVCVDPSLPANQSSSIVGIIASNTHDAAANSVSPCAGLLYNLDSSIIFSNVGIQIGGPRTSIAAPVITSTGVPSVKSDLGTSRTNNENSFLMSTTDTQDGASAEDLQESKQTTPVAGKVHATPLEEKTSEEPVGDANKLDARNTFRTLLESVKSSWTWKQAMRFIVNDKRYCALETLEESMLAFNEYFNQREKLESEERCVKQRKAHNDFVTMMKESNKLTSDTSLRKAITLFEDDERFIAVEHSREREDLVEDYLVELQKKEKAKVAEEYTRNIQEYRDFLKSCDFIKASTWWRKVQDQLEDDERCSRLEIVDRLDIFKEYIQDLEKEEEEQKRLRQDQARRQERKNRDDFRKILEEHVADGTLTVKSCWGVYSEQVKDSQAYLAVASNTSGSTPKDLFEYVMEDLEEQYQADKAQIKEAIESGKIPLMTSWTLEGFRTAIMENVTLKGISDMNIKLIYEKQIKRLREKELNEAKKRQRLGERFLDLLYSIMEISASSTWDDSKPFFEDSREYRALNSEIYAAEIFEKYVLHLKERAKVKERLREEQKAKKDQEREEKERKREREEKERKREREEKERKREREEKEWKKEKERKEKERKEKEREREKERAKDSSRKDSVDLDGSYADTHGSKDKKMDKDKANKHKRRQHDTRDDTSERDESKQSQRHSSDHKKSRKQTLLLRRYKKK